MVDAIRVGLVGYGAAGRIFHAPLLRAVPAMALTVISTSKANEVAALDPTIRCAGSAADIFSDPAIDLVVIATPSATHAPLAADALRAGKHVVVDKPFALSLAEAKDLAALAAQCGRQLAVFHNRRFDSDFLSIRAGIEDGLVGRITHFESHFDRFRPDVRDRWREDGSPGSGVWFDLGPHLVDQALAMFGRPQSVNADIAALREGSASDDWAHVVLLYPDMRVVLHASMSAPGGEDGGSPRFMVHGMNGTLVKKRLDQQEAQLVAGLRPGDLGWGADDDPVVYHDGQGRVTLRQALPGCQQDYYAQVATAILSGAPLPVTLEQAVAVQEVIEAAQISAREGRRVALPLP
ncbi:oxidoreductase [Sphingobium sp. AS12]|uniref:oxidoreductase n=1 Tax=Sphingobium sp. AS12 TaxID=2849495 RepID=UPI001C31AAE2|nr:oxidoreductase [Sphingobium sp. AS12]